MLSSGQGVGGIHVDDLLVVVGNVIAGGVAIPLRGQVDLCLQLSQGPEW